MMIFVIVSVGVINISIDTIQRDSKYNLSSEALLYAQEGIEASKNIANKNFLFLTNGDKGLEYSLGSWSFVTAPEGIDGFFSRTITIEDVYRDVSGDIDSEGTVIDPDTKMITSEVTWLQKGVIPRSESITAYFTNWSGYDFIESTCAEFNLGAFDDAETVPGVTPPPDNCDIELTSVIPPGNFFSSADLGHHGNDVVVEGNYVFMSAESSAAGFSVVDVTDRSSPVTVQVLDIGYKGNKLTSAGGYIWIGNQSSTGLTNVIKSTPSSSSWFFEVTLGAIGNQPAVSGNYLYQAVNSALWGLQVFDISGVATPSVTTVGLYTFGYKVYEIEINGSTAYLGLDDDTYGFRIIDITNPAAITQLAQLDVGEEVNAIELSGSLAFVGTEDTNNSLHVVNVSNPSAPTLVTSLDVGGEIQDLTISGNFLYAAIDESQAGLSAIDITNPYAPSLSYNLDVQGKGIGIDADSTHVYIATDTSNKGLVIIETATKAVTIMGTYTSSIFDTGSVDTRYNYIEWDHTEVPNGSIKFQIRTASSEAGIATETWVGPDGTSATFYTNPRTAIVLDPGTSGPRYCQYQATLNSDGSTSPTLHSVKINYNP